MGLEPFDRYSIPALKSLDLSDPPQGYSLAYYNRTKPVVIQTDASEVGLGAALLQGGWPIAFASKTLTDVESCYANIERERVCLSVCFGLKKFHTYNYGRHVLIENDHKLLEMIQHKPIHAAPPRLQQMLLHMQKYDYHSL